MYSVSIAQFYRINTLYIWLRQHYSTRIWIIWYSFFNSVMMTPDFQTDVLLIRARPFQNLCCNNVENLTRWKFISVPIKFSPCINTTVDLPWSHHEKWITCQQEVHVAFLIAIFKEKLIFVSVRGKIPFSFYRISHREEREEYLRNIPSAYNYRLQAPLENITTQEEAEEMFPDEFRLFLENNEPLKKTRSTLRMATLHQ